MKKVITIILFALLGSPSLLAQSNEYHLSFTAGTKTPTTFCVDLTARFNTNKKLGSSNLVFTFDPTVLANPVMDSYTLDTLNDYHPLTITTPFSGRASMNIFLKEPGNGNGADYSNTAAQIARVCFDVVDQTQPIELNWLESSNQQTVLFDDNNAATQPNQLVPGILENFNQTSFPVSWLSFEAELEDFDAVLAWETGSEINNSHFEIERALPGEDFMKIGQIEGVGNSVEVNPYAFTDRHVLQYESDILLYRSKQVDIDGKFDYSQTVELTLVKGELLQAKAFPNVFDEEVQIEYQSATLKPTLVRVINELGQEVYTQNSKEFEELYKLNTRNWAKGIYTVSVVSGTHSKSIRIQK